MYVSNGKIVSSDGRVFITRINSSLYELNLWKGSEYIKTVKITRDVLVDSSEATSDLYSYLMLNDYVDFFEIDELLNHETEVF